MLKPSLATADRLANGISHTGEDVKGRNYCYKCNEFYPCRVRLAAWNIAEEAYQQALNDVIKVIQALPVHCKFDPTPLRGDPIGMFHCPECGDMVLAGMPHPPCDEVADILEVLQSNEEKEGTA